MKRRNNLFFTVSAAAVLFALAYSGHGFAQSGDYLFSDNVIPAAEQGMQTIVLNRGYGRAENPAVYFPPSISPGGKKSVRKGMFFSLLLPGTGQMYAQKGNESLIKGAGFLAVEALSWTLYFHYRSKGSTYENKFESYAAVHWDIDKYLTFLEDQLGLAAFELGRESTNNIDKVKLYQSESAWGALTGVSTHHLFGSGMQQYYEMIYKYPEQFALGWSDATVPGPAAGESPTGYTYKTLTPRMKYYRGLRNESNRFFRYSRNLTGVILVNHFLSAIDAAWTVKRKNQESARIAMGLRIEPNRINNKIVYMPKIQMSF